MVFKCVPTAISSGVDISEVTCVDISEVACHLLQQIIFQCGSQKLLQKLGPHKLIFHLSGFDLFLTKWNDYIIKRI